MTITDENIEFCLQAMKVDFLKKRWEREWYAQALKDAADWGRKIDQKNEEYNRKNRLPDKYNV